jgi:hypothetical protein
MELSWPMKLRIAAAAGVGVVLIGIAGWPLVAPAEPFGIVSAATVSLGGAISLAALAFSAGLLAYFVSWPYGRQIAVLAVPSGLALWAVRCGNMAAMMQMKPTVGQRLQILTALKYEPVFWLAIVAAGFLAVWVGRKISSQKAGTAQTQKNSKWWLNMGLSAAVAVVFSVLIGRFCIGILAADVRIFDSKLGSAAAQPAVGQIVFAVLVSFGLAGFAVKKFLNAGYIWPIISAAFITAFVNATYVKQDILAHFAGRLPAVFFPHPVLCILPVQMVAFGTLGSIIGYWLAIRYNYWRKHEI